MKTSNPSDLALQEVTRLGTKKYFDDRGAYRNPYQQGTPEYNEFERGWTQALKKDNARLATEYQTQGQQAGERIDKRAHVKSLRLSKQYRERKG